MLVVVILTEYLVSANRRRQQKTEKKGCKHFQNWRILYHSEQMLLQMFKCWTAWF